MFKSIFLTLIAAIIGYVVYQNTPIEEKRRLNINFFEERETLNIFFVGNSYTAYRIPEMIGKISESDPNSPIKFEIDSYSKGGSYLKEAWAEKIALDKIKEKPRDIVILQEHSLWAMYKTFEKEAYDIAPTWRNGLSGLTKDIVLYVTWPRKPNSKWYTQRETAAIKNPAYMLKKTTTKSKKLASLLGAKIIPIGDYWYYFITNRPEINLYHQDATHPSTAGAYLTALVFYQYFTGLTSVESVTYAPEGLDKKEAKLIRETLS